MMKEFKETLHLNNGSASRLDHDIHRRLARIDNLEIVCLGRKTSLNK